MEPKRVRIADIDTSGRYRRGHENHRHENWGVGGMVYWAVEHLRQLAGLSDVLQAER